MFLEKDSVAATACGKVKLSALVRKGNKYTYILYLASDGEFERGPPSMLHINDFAPH